MYFSQGLEEVQTKRHQQTRQSISHVIKKFHFYSLQKLSIFSLCFHSISWKPFRPSFILNH